MNGALKSFREISRFVLMSNLIGAAIRNALLGDTTRDTLCTVLQCAVVCTGQRTIMKQNIQMCWSSGIYRFAKTKTWKLAAWKRRWQHPKIAVPAAVIMKTAFQQFTHLQSFALFGLPLMRN